MSMRSLAATIILLLNIYSTAFAACTTNFFTSAGTIGVLQRYFVCATDVDKPSSGVSQGDLAYVKDVDALYQRTASAWVAVVAGGGSGNVSNTGTPTSGQVAEWTDATHVQGVSTTGSGSYVRATSPALVRPMTITGI